MSINRVLVYLRDQQSACRNQYVAEQAANVAARLEKATAPLLEFSPPRDADSVRENGLQIHFWIVAEPEPIRSLTDVVLSLSRNMDPDAPDGPQFKPSAEDFDRLDVTEFDAAPGQKMRRAL